MNQKQWKSLETAKNKPNNFWYWRNLAYKYFVVPKGFVIHHLRDTEEQRNFNNNYYERWGFDFDGKMKYCICISKDKHREIHRFSEDTKLRMSKSARCRNNANLRGVKTYTNGIVNIRRKPGSIIPDGFYPGITVSKNAYGHSPTPEAIQKGLETKRRNGNDKHTPEWNRKIGLANKGKTRTPEQRLTLSLRLKGKPSVMKGKTLTEEHKRKISESTKLAMKRSAVIAKVNAAREKLKNAIMWTNGIRNKRAINCPGDGWYKGYTVPEKLKGQIWWTNHIIETKAKDCPGEGWEKGRLVKKWYTKKEKNADK